MAGAKRSNHQTSNNVGGINAPADIGPASAGNFNMLRVTGKIAFVDQEEKRSEVFKKCVFGIETEDGKEIYFTAFNARIEALKGLKEGQLVTVGYSINCRTFEKDGKKSRYTSLLLITLDRLAATPVHSEVALAEEPIFSADIAEEPQA
jgi:hypothetical protein